MIYKYEIACKEAGLSEERIKEIRKIFDDDKKKLKRSMKFREEAGIVFNSLTALAEEYGGDEENGLDSGFNLEETVIHNWELEKLDICLNELSADDREFIIAVFSEERGTIFKMAKEMGIPRSTLMYRKEKILKSIKKSFLKKS